MAAWRHMLHYVRITQWCEMLLRPVTKACQARRWHLEFFFITVWTFKMITCDITGNGSFTFTTSVTWWKKPCLFSKLLSFCCSACNCCVVFCCCVRAFATTALRVSFYLARLVCYWLPASTRFLQLWWWWYVIAISLDLSLKIDDDVDLSMTRYSWCDVRRSHAVLMMYIGI